MNWTENHSCELRIVVSLSAVNWTENPMFTLVLNWAELRIQVFQSSSELNWTENSGYSIQ